MNRDDLFNHLKFNTCVLQTTRMEKAFAEIDRGDFISDDYTPEAYEDYTLPIGFNQTITKPTTVAFMLELLNVEALNRVLDVGSGSGWTTALIAKMLEKEGRVFGVEIVPELAEKGRSNLKKYKLYNAQIADASRTLGLSAHGPYDRILVSASAEEIPETLLKQLKIGGIMVVPIDDSLVRVVKISNDRLEKKTYHGFNFAPLATF